MLFETEFALIECLIHSLSVENVYLVKVLIGTLKT